MPTDVKAYRKIRQTRQRRAKAKKIRYTKAQLERLAAVVYAELPEGPWMYGGFSCGTCVFFDKSRGLCTHRDILAPVRVNGCCCAWLEKEGVKPTLDATKEVK